MDTKIKIIFKELGRLITSRTFYLLLGIFLALTLAVVYAVTWNDVRTSGSGKLTESNWNSLIDMLESEFNTLKAGGGGGGGITGGCWSQVIGSYPNFQSMNLPWGKGCNYYYGSGYIRCDSYTATGYACGVVSHVEYPSVPSLMDFCLCVKQ